jgi:acetoin utilization protein AcuB
MQVNLSRMDPRQMERIPPIKAVMTPFPHSVEIDDSIETARKVMSANAIRHLAVTEEGRLVGVVSAREIELATGVRVVGDIKLAGAYVVELNERLDRVLLAMAKSHLGSALVVKRGKLVGIFTTSDACRIFGECLRNIFPNDDDEAA